MSGIQFWFLVWFGAWALFIVAALGRVQLVYLATSWAIDVSVRLQDAAHEAGKDWRPYHDALDMEAAYRWRSILNPLRWRYAHFYPELERLRRAAA